jgi:hypothetical protein
MSLKSNLANSPRGHIRDDATDISHAGETEMKSKAELEEIIKKIAAGDSPVGMDAVYVHALILDKLDKIEIRLDRLETIASEKLSEGNP